jgi:hypothetical protein
VASFGSGSVSGTEEEGGSFTTLFKKEIFEEMGLY